MADIMQTISPDTLKTEYLTKENCEFFVSSHGFLGARINGREYKRVILARALPLSEPDKFVTILNL